MVIHKANNVEDVMATGALDGIRVLDFTSFISGPYCTRLLADCGAEVVKVEPPGGDPLRAAPPVVSGGSRYFAAYNCGKKSIALDLKDAAAADLAARLAERCDVLVENFRPGVMEKASLGYEQLCRRNPRLIYASISGFGQSGPMSGFPAYGPIVQALSGFERAFLSYQPAADTPPVVGIQIADVIAAIFAFGAIQTALLQRERRGVGDWIDLSLIESIMATINADLQAAQVGVTPRIGFRPIRATDDFIMVLAVTAKGRENLARVLGDSSPLTAPSSMAGFGDLYVRLEKWASERTAAECRRVLMANGVPCATYESPESVLASEHLEQRGTFTAVDAPGGAFRINNAPFRFQRAQSGIRGTPPELGEHGKEVLASWLGET
jgi:crotonobetainyl-CoA:carnitine CoA-transferase CaiB-like acyl-CoA transferase